MVPLSEQDSVDEPRYKIRYTDGKEAYVIHRDIRTININDLDYFYEGVSEDTYFEIIDKVFDCVFDVQSVN